MDTLDPHLPKPSTSEPSEAVNLEVATLRAMLGLPLEEPEPDGRAPPEPTQTDKPIPPDQDTTN